MGSNDYEDAGEWRRRLILGRKCPKCGHDLGEAGSGADPDKLFLFGLVFIIMAVAAKLEYAEGYTTHVCLLQVSLGVGLIGWSIFRYREQHKRASRRHRRIRTTPRLSDIIAATRNVQQDMAPAEPAKPATYPGPEAAKPASSEPATGSPPLR